VEQKKLHNQVYLCRIILG